jgi:hypothetical protein
VCEQVVRLLPGISPQGYYALLHRLLHLDAAASYADQEMSGEVERVEKCLSAIPVREDTITLITVIHLTGRPLFNSDALDAIGKIVKRAASLQVSIFLLSLSIYLSYLSIYLSKCLDI